MAMSFQRMEGRPLPETTKAAPGGGLGFASDTCDQRSAMGADHHQLRFTGTYMERSIADGTFPGLPPLGGGRIWPEMV
ncbi:hypothetical protein GCM10012280_07370 [Wenjunlia tyrosinilytica]|uniref:Uncharacterized protein n=1 Tax=Wenjunlia tyrosinilytica TaxID=1544741 RepID=A0A917ZHJ3_9ACTN|nr:hypothetical protein GCM10012280_07370 [Wenjunlia tyrosinilytica]